MKAAIINRENPAGIIKIQYLQMLKKDIARDWRLYVMLIPAVIYFFLFVYRPIWGLQIAFREYNIFLGYEGSPWVGLKNFTAFFTGPYFWRLLKNTVLISIYGLVFGFPVPIILALLFNEVRCSGFRRFVQTCTYIPYFISAVVVAGLVTNFLSPSTGIVNQIIAACGGERQYFLTKPEWFRPIYTIMNIWKNAGFNSIIYLSALTAVNAELYEAAVLDGAGRWKQTWHITLPSILPTIVMMLIMNVGNMLNVGYETILLLYQPATYETADVINTYVYRTGLMDSQYSQAAAVGMFNGFVGLLLVCGANYISKRLTEYSLW